MHMRCSRTMSMCVAVVFAASVPVALVAEQSAQAPAGQGGAVRESALDSQLFQPRSPGTTDGADNGSTGSEQPAVQSRSVEAESLEAESLEAELGNAALPEEAEQIARLIEKVQQAESRLRAGDAGAETQQVQREVIAALNELIKQAQKRCSRPSPSASYQRPQQNETEAPTESATAGTQPGQGTAGEDRPGAVGAESLQQILHGVWGELPERERRRLMQLPGEQFLPKYRAMIEEYFRRLAGREEGASP